ncbi:HAD family hydrolase [Tamlana agarivorans]|uniref:HAD family hydrolase n=1 Tax=Pseudotamlana agarivorans TaxID=481183 RepID=A0ACC5UCM3_9FLAO|nr:HAD family hydrolase [Tamlana agarivorans]MBU2951994.1 HAD family hydrolase [Tamlana agarivorans]
MNQLKEKIKTHDIKVLFTDYYDTLVHREVHPNNTIRIWSKIMINELGLDISIDHLYFIYKESIAYLVNVLKTDRNELSYVMVQDEIFNRLNNANVLGDHQKEVFIQLFEKAHLRSEVNVQKLNPNTLGVIKEFKEKGGKVYLLSDFYGPTSLFIKLLDHHKISHLFDGVYSSSTVGKSKHTGTIYKQVLTELNLDPNQVLMMGDNERSDFKNAEKAGLHAYLLPHDAYLRKNKWNSFGDDSRKLKKVTSQIYSLCNKKSATPYTEYAISYHFFVERLYIHCKKNNIKSLFFLSREGLFLKRLFDSYLEFHQIDKGFTIRSHYLKISRQASLQIALNPIEEEEFKYLNQKYKSVLSIYEFLTFFNLEEAVKVSIVESLEFDKDQLVEGFFTSEIFKTLKQNEIFKEAYEAHRLSNKTVFSEYINSFNEDIETDGIHVVDIGWGGTMQEAIYNFYDSKIKVTGLYLGVSKIYTITPDTKRYGLNFSVLPFENYNTHILRANAQLYEQFSGAGHGCCVEYKKNEAGYTIEHYDTNEKWLYDNHIGSHQDDMFKVHQLLLEKLKNICYNQDMVGNALNYVALNSGLIQNSRKIKFLDTLNEGYFQNISIKKTGIDYEVPENLMTIKTLISFLITPEIYFRYLVKLKRKLYAKNKVIAYLFPSFLIYGYYVFNKYIRFKVLKNTSLLKYNYLR